MAVGQQSQDRRVTIGRDVAQTTVTQPGVAVAKASFGSFFDAFDDPNTRTRAVNVAATR